MKLGVSREKFARSVNADEINVITSARSAGNLNFTNRFLLMQPFNVAIHQRDLLFILLPTLKLRMSQRRLLIVARFIFVTLF